MKKFDFKLEAVRKLREAREKEALKVLSAAQRALQEEIERKNVLERRLEESRTRLENLGHTPAPITEFHTEQHFIDGTIVRIRHAETLIRRATRAVEKAMAVYLQAQKNRKMIERLRERQYEEWTWEMRREEQRRQDDLTSIREASAAALGTDGILGWGEMR
jgi:flagellar FliJ protein